MNKAAVRFVVVATAIFLIGLVLFPSFLSARGVDFKPQSVNRALKADRSTTALPQVTNKRQLQPSLERVGKQVPVGCDRAFSSMSGPQFSGLFGRCAV
jgi:hypothetical protein